jgi:hypothetical protein
MIIRTPLLAFVTALAVLCAALAEAQSNASASLILPPENWDAHRHVLASLVGTNRPGQYQLRPAWVGLETVTARSGWYATEAEVITQTNQWLRFDQLTVCSGPIVPVAREDRFICNASNDSAPSFAYRPVLPTDGGLLEMHDVASLTNFLGFNPFAHDEDRTSAFSACYFTLAPYDSIATCEVVFMKRKGSKIDGVIVRRGHFHQ